MTYYIIIKKYQILDYYTKHKNNNEQQLVFEIEQIYKNYSDCFKYIIRKLMNESNKYDSENKEPNAYINNLMYNNSFYSLLLASNIDTKDIYSLEKQQFELFDEIKMKQIFEKINKQIKKDYLQIRKLVPNFEFEDLINLYFFEIDEFKN
jgi:hypothetical protein